MPFVWMGKRRGVAEGGKSQPGRGALLRRAGEGTDARSQTRTGRGKSTDPRVSRTAVP